MPQSSISRSSSTLSNTTRRSRTSTATRSSNCTSPITSVSPTSYISLLPSPPAFLLLEEPLPSSADHSSSSSQHRMLPSLHHIHHYLSDHPGSRGQRMVEGSNTGVAPGISRRRPRLLRSAATEPTLTTPNLVRPTVVSHTSSNHRAKDLLSKVAVCSSSSGPSTAAVGVGSSQTRQRRQHRSSASASTSSVSSARLYHRGSRPDLLQQSRSRRWQLQETGPGEETEDDEEEEGRKRKRGCIRNDRRSRPCIEMTKSGNYISFPSFDTWTQGSEDSAATVCD